MNWPEAKPLLDEYPLLSYIKVSDKFIMDDRLHPEEIKENA